MEIYFVVCLWWPFSPFPFDFQPNNDAFFDILQLFRHFGIVCDSSNMIFRKTILYALFKYLFNAIWAIKY